MSFRVIQNRCNLQLDLCTLICMSLNHMFKLKELRFFSCGFCHSVNLSTFFPFGSHGGFYKMDVMQIQKAKRKGSVVSAHIIPLSCFLCRQFFLMLLCERTLLCPWCFVYVDTKKISGLCRLLPGDLVD